MVRHAYRVGQPVPSMIQNAPTLHDGLALYFNAFIELGSCRSIGFGVGPIPWTAMREYARWMRMDRQDAADFFWIMQKMDEAYLKFQKEKSDQEAASKAKGRKGGRKIGE